MRMRVAATAVVLSLVCIPGCEITTKFLVSKSWPVDGTLSPKDGAVNTQVAVEFKWPTKKPPPDTH